jgi:hypothetical protein
VAGHILAFQEAADQAQVLVRMDEDRGTDAEDRRRVVQQESQRPAMLLPVLAEIISEYPVAFGPQPKRSMRGRTLTLENWSKSNLQSHFITGGQPT